MKKIMNLLLNRVTIVAVLLLLQIYLLVGMVLWFNDYFALFYGLCILLSVLATVGILQGKDNPAYKIAWIIPILLFPIFGGLFYLFFGGNKSSRSTRQRMGRIGNQVMEARITDGEDILQELESEDRNGCNQSSYIARHAFSPPYRNTYTEYFPLGELKFARLKEELEKAERFIFLEYFIIGEGRMWGAILDILTRKAAQGVDVRVVYDDVGSLLKLPYRYDRKLEALGIKCCIFNPFVPVLSLHLNNRDHRKIAVIDGNTGFTGGINLDDEYINLVQVHGGHWKDTAVMLKGEAVWNLTVMFLTIWNYLRGEDDDFSKFHPRLPAGYGEDARGIVQPYSDSPLDDEFTGENVYLNLINRAERYVYINTPYLIIDNEMRTALALAAKSGVDVRIVTPHIPDKWYVHMVTQANYEFLLESGVKIYEYTPGFMHAKSFVVDDRYGTVGTVNLDFRSMFLHFECGVWMRDTDCLLDIKRDYLETLAVCREMTLEMCHACPWPKKLLQLILQAFAPLM